MLDPLEHPGGTPGTKPAPASILLVEDDPIGLKSIASMLQDAGYATHCVADGRGCLQAAAELRPDLIIMDAVLPRLDGVEACRRLKTNAQCRRIPVIFITGTVDEQTLQAAFEAGGSDYVRKPVSRIELLARVRTALTQCRMMRQQADEEKLKAVLEMAGGICHELNQPLQYMLGAVQLLMMDLADDEGLYSQLDAIRASIEQMGEITRSLCAITRLRTRKYVGCTEILDIDGSLSESKGD